MIFEDFSHKRWKKAKIIFIIMATLAVLLLIGVVSSIIVNPPLPSVAERRINERKAYNEKQAILKNEATGKTASIKKNTNKSINSLTNNIFPLSTSTPISAGFLVQDDPESIKSLTNNGSKINIVFPDWYFLTSDKCSVLEKEDPEITKIIASSTAADIMPRLTNALDGKWYGPETSRMLANTETRDCFAGAVVDLVIKSGATGLNLDLEALTANDKNNLSELVATLSQKLHQAGKILTVDITGNDPAYDPEYLGLMADYVVLMAYDEHYVSGEPGPIASRDWYNDIIDQAMNQIPANKLIIALGSYGYDWTDGSKTPAESLKFSEIMTLAKESGAQPELKSDYGYNNYFGYTDYKNKSHQVWFLNGVTAYNEYLNVKQNNLAGVALWRLGSEDETYWRIFDNNLTAQSFISLPKLNTATYESEGELFSLKNQNDTGTLQLTTDTDGSIDYAIYDKLPVGYVLTAIGKPFPDKSVILTFDDGPDEVWTPQILAVLQKYQVPAAFFMVGDQAQRNPRVLKMMANNKNILFGNHTYLHPDITLISHSRLQLELNKTQRVIEAETGHQTIMFRPPYDTDSTPTNPEQLKSLSVVKDAGYIIAGANLDAEDWQKPGVPAIINNVVDGLSNGSNHIIVMHDAGGDRSQTVAALDKLIPLLKSKGYTFMSLGQASGIGDSALNPNLSQKEMFFVDMTKIWSFITYWSWMVVVWLFLMTTIIAIFRILFLGIMVLRSEKHYRKRNAAESCHDPITVLVPAYNEEKTIARTLEALQKSTKNNFEVLVLDDGSTDNTAEETKKIMASDDRIRLISKPNGGKSSALNLGFKEAKYDLIITIDGDTILLPDTLEELTKPFIDPKVDAVCGNVEVGNVRNVLTGFQTLEYITTQNFDRRAFDELNCISVVPGATGAWRKQRVIDLGGYGLDTLTEDADLTLRLLADGGRIIYAPEARSLTEAPETISGLAKQRFRWSYGTYQCLYKNRNLFFKGNLGWVALPNMLFFQIIFPILSPIGDIVFFLSIFRGDFGAIAIGYLMFTAMDLCGSLLAFTLEKRAKKIMWLILIQRFFYRQFMYVVTYKSIIAIIRGGHYGWNKLKRTGNVRG